MLFRCFWSHLRTIVNITRNKGSLRKKSDSTTPLTAVISFLFLAVAFNLFKVYRGSDFTNSFGKTLSHKRRREKQWKKFIVASHKQLHQRFFFILSFVHFFYRSFCSRNTLGTTNFTSAIIFFLVCHERLNESEWKSKMEVKKILFNFLRNLTKRLREANNKRRKEKKDTTRNDMN